MSLTPELLARIERLEFEARQVVEGYLAGRHRSPRHGFAVEFAQHREYAPGDDLRHIDWKVYGRTERYYLKQYEQETNLVAWLLVDTSESMAYGSGARSKYQTAATLAAALAFLTVNQTDSAGLVAISDKIETFLRPSSSNSHVKDVVRFLANGPTTKPGALAATMHEVAGRLGRRGVVFLISDLLDDPAPILESIQHIRYFKHEVVVLQVLDPAEVDFPFRHPTEFRGLEDLGKLPTDPLSIRESYLTSFNEHIRILEEGLRAQKTDFVRVLANEDLGQMLSTYLRKRENMKA